MWSNLNTFMSESETTFVKLTSSDSWQPGNTFPVPNRGMNFGDGIFETMFFDGQKVRFADYHLARAKRGLEILGIEAKDLNFPEMETLVSKTYSGQKIRVRWTLFRAGSGKYTPSQNSLCQILQLEGYSSPPPFKSHAGLGSSVVLHPSPISSLKTLNGLSYILAAQERVRKGWDEIILLDSKRNIAEAGSSNIFWKNGNIVFTPGLGTGCIAGVGRAAILSGFRDVGVEVREGYFSKDDLFKAELVWVSNALGVSYLERFEFAEFSTEGFTPLEDIFK